MLSPTHILHTLKTECGYLDGDSILVGVSGGADSVALLHLIHAAGIPCAAAHVNYGLRGEESDGDEQFVSELCGKLNVPLYLKRTSHSELDSINNNLQAAARSFRYSFFEEIRSKESMTWIAVAHHSDDQLETVLMNFMRGTGLHGITGMQFGNGNIIRPLLNSSRIEITTYLRTENLKWRDDSTNVQDDYLRNRIRNHVIPEFQKADERNSAGWKNSIAQLNNDAELLEVLIHPWISLAVTREGNVVRIKKDEIIECQFPHLLLNWLLHSNDFRMKFSLEEFMQLINQQPGKKYILGKRQLVVDRDHFLLCDVDAVGFSPFQLHPGHQEGEWSCFEITVQNPKDFSGPEALIACEIASSKLEIRSWMDGDKFQPYGFNGTRKVSDVLTEMKISSHEKANYPVLTCNDEIAWIPGYRIADKYKVTPETKTALHIKWNR